MKKVPPDWPTMTPDSAQVLIETPPIVQPPVTHDAQRIHATKDNSPVVSKQSMAFNVHDSVHQSFMESLDKMINDGHYVKTEVPQPTTTHPLYLNILTHVWKEGLVQCKQSEVYAVELEHVPRAYEEAFMQQPREGDLLCTAAEDCECLQIASFAGSTLGFRGKAFYTPNTTDRSKASLCVLCMRKKCALAYFSMKAHGHERTTRLLQPYANIVNEPGEYAADACIYPSSVAFDGISDPFVRHERHRYEYHLGADGQRFITQRNVDFRQPPTMSACSTCRGKGRHRGGGKQT